MNQTRFLPLAVLLSATIALAAPADGAAAGGSPITTEQSKVADAAFLQYAPAPSAGAGALCLVDSGVHPNPDTTPGLIYATSLDGATNDDVDPQGHGTIMAMTAGGAGVGLRGAWPQLKIVSVRETNVPPPSQEPSYEFDNYTQGVSLCEQLQAKYPIKAIELALTSTLPPSPDEIQNFADAVSKAQSQNIAIVAAAGNTPGTVEWPGQQAGILAVGAGDPTNGICPFSATQGVTLFGPGCNLDMADPFTDTYEPQLGGQGTSQASAFTAAVVVALMSYDPNLTASNAETLLLKTANGGFLDVAAAFNADSLGAIVNQGNANIPPPPAATTSTTSTTTSTAPAPAPKPRALVGKPTLRSLTWRRGTLAIRLRSLPRG
ncbi:MAG TPA: S8 family serine peptidase, partial [Solirubrobacteraceae bacterium]|nr:S8 family serine peptidase [Solirubrobacteraceae bacterium]